MTQFQSGPITEISTQRADLYAFRINGHIEGDDAEKMAQYMLAAFDRHPGKVDMLLDLSGFTGSDWDSMLDFDVIKSRFRALSDVRRYAVIGAPDRAQKMIEFFDGFIETEARAFDAARSAEAWQFVDEPPHAA